jgi:hypothetical protein
MAVTSEASDAKRSSWKSSMDSIDAGDCDRDLDATRLGSSGRN